MFDLKDKSILILSPQSWGNMFLSKHHYAIELAKRGNRVYFLNPPYQEAKLKWSSVTIRHLDDYKNLYLVNHRLWFPYVLKFKALPVFHVLMGFQIKRLLKKIGRVDIVWSFDIGHHYPLQYFSNDVLKVFHPVDEPLDKPAIDAAGGADIIFGVTREILDKYKSLAIPSHFINHGLPDEFIYENIVISSHQNSLHVGFSGNLTRTDLDMETLLTIVSENPTVQFEFWGNYPGLYSNLAYNLDENHHFFFNRLKLSSNVVLHGPVSTRHLAMALPKMDAFLICYDVQRDHSKGTNYHKIMEYLATGKVVISNNVTTYKDRPDLIQMSKCRDSNKDLPELFKTVLSHIKEFNSKENMLNRRAFVKENTYSKQLDRIEFFFKGMKNQCVK